jgi:RHS repeat-associated protein
MVAGTQAGTFAFRFSTKHLDAETGLLYYGYRYYAPGTGRWISRDPLGEEGGVNVFAFLRNDAGNNAIDPVGLTEAALGGISGQLWQWAKNGNVAEIAWTIENSCLTPASLLLANELLVIANKINHVFNKEDHNLDGFVAHYGGDKYKALQAIKEAAAEHPEIPQAVIPIP